MSEEDKKISKKNEKKLALSFGKISTILAVISFGGDFMAAISPLSLTLGVIGLSKDVKKAMAITGIVLSILNIMANPVLWGNIYSLLIRGHMM